MEWNTNKVRRIIEENKGILVEGVYKNVNSRLTITCNRGHTWETSARMITDGRWCRRCASIETWKNRNPYSVEDVRKVAEMNGGTLVSDKYVGTEGKYVWKCSDGHEWSSSFYSVKSLGTWCPKCAGVAVPLFEDMHKLAKKKNGECLSIKYINAHSKLKWKCKEGHIWEATPTHIQGGRWCPYCSGLVGRYSTEILEDIAIQRHGKFLSGKYTKSEDLHKWECKRRHKFLMRPKNVIRGSWCPRCHDSRAETVCRKIMESIFDNSFPKQRPLWLTGSSGFRLELDGYNSNLRIAFEYQGRQHYERSFTFSNIQNLKAIQKRDEEKRVLCRIHGVKLIEVSHTVKFGDMVEYILGESKKLGIDTRMLNKMVTYHQFDSESYDQIDDINKVARTKGGACLSESYINGHTKLKFKCKNNHVWEATPASVKSGTWCLRCSYKRNGEERRLKSLKQIQKIAKDKKGKCLTQEYRADSKLEFVCVHNHFFKLGHQSIKQGSWCPKCRSRLKTTPKVI